MNTRKMIFISVFSAIMCVLSPIAIPIGTVPLTLSAFAVFLASLCLNKAEAFAATVIYIFLGALGLPVFSGFRGGFTVLFGATGGFIWAYPLMTLVAYKKHLLLSLLLSLLLCYTIGAAQLSLVSGITLTKAFYIGVLPFIPFDILKIILALFVSKPLKKACASFNKLS